MVRSFLQSAGQPGVLIKNPTGWVDGEELPKNSYLVERYIINR